MSGRYSQCSRSKLWVYIFIGNYLELQFFSSKAYIICFTNIFFVSLVGWMNRHSSVSQLCLGASCGYGYWKIFVVFEGIEKRLSLFVYNLIIRYGRLSLRIPVNNSVLANDQTIIVHFFECSTYGKVPFIIQSVCLS